jgi:hypothetical protein
MFPKTARLREELSALQNTTYGALYSFFRDDGSRVRAVEEASTLLQQCWDLLGYFDDLRTYVANASLASLTGLEVAPPGDRAPYLGNLRLDENGNLRLPEAAATVR